jgi:phosphonate transport system ATP-binding protein
MLQVDNLTKIYDDGTIALKDVTFNVPDRAFMTVIGLSGSGKSTLLRCINRLIEPTAGRIIWDGVDVTAAKGEDLRHIRRQIGMIFQQFNLIKRASVMTNVLSGRLGYVNPLFSMINYFPREDRQRALKALERTGLTEKRNNRADALSGGQQQRVGIARTLMQEPRLLLADEPVSALDPVLAHSILGQLEDLNKQDGITVMCSLHYLDLVQRYSTHVIALRAGEVVFEGDNTAIRELTADRFREIYGQDAEVIGTGKSITGGDLKL